MIAKIKAIKILLGDFLGVEASEINDDDSLSEDLHMSPIDITDFVETLSQEGYKTDNVDLTEIETVLDLTENLSQDNQ